jgi:hypothetical protein
VLSQVPDGCGYVWGWVWDNVCVLFWWVYGVGGSITTQLQIGQDLNCHRPASLIHCQFIFSHLCALRHMHPRHHSTLPHNGLADRLHLKPLLVLHADHLCHLFDRRQHFLLRRFGFDILWSPNSSPLSLRPHRRCGNWRCIIILCLEPSVCVCRRSGWWHVADDFYEYSAVSSQYKRNQTAYHCKLHSIRHSGPRGRRIRCRLEINYLTAIQRSPLQPSQSRLRSTYSLRTDQRRYRLSIRPGHWFLHLSR